ncbi:complex I NDUFA9 subunit family protein [Rhizorhabdus dicambivorans]|uniref:Complex I NDUFA9 subunit family protein n=1 Tax=Rhizorhabdus dicambivorans TaxID=1850238 RepID=A0A2A4FTI1_9SPHN|nr:complex I NDUFA9 subunit family protein [Rhizorhabdus dicambivorans]PCE41004.1 complex I NDUFA9 subunit family protein [Rhizorhabdus dicambivorans]
MGRLVTIFGGGGFLGRYVAQELLKAGARVRIAERDPSDAWFLKPLGGLGQTQFLPASVTHVASVEHAVAGADSVINLVGILKGDFDAIHRRGAANVAAAAKAAGAGALVHVSAIGADPESASAYGRSKGEGEAAVRAAFPDATIIRPSIVFGQEDGFLNRFAGMLAMPFVPVLRGDVKFQPVWVADVARAIAAAALDPNAHAGKTYELGGPEVVTMAGLNQRLADATGHNPTFIPVPDAIGGILATVAGALPGAPITRDQWLMLQADNVVSPGASGLEAFGIKPTPMEAVAPAWLVRYRPHGRFAPQTKTAA